MKRLPEIIELLKEIENDYFKGIYTAGEYCDLTSVINKQLTTMCFNK
jgi:hypothetical protein